MEHNLTSLPRPERTKTHIDSIDKWLSAFAIYCMFLLTQFPQRAVEMFCYQEIIHSAHRKFAGLAWLSYDIDFRRKAASNPALNWGERDIQLYLLKFTGQAKSSCPIGGSGDHLSLGCSLSALRPSTTTQRGTCNNLNRGAKCSRIHAPTAIVEKPATETTQPTGTMTPLQKLEARARRSH